MIKHVRFMLLLAPLAWAMSVSADEAGEPNAGERLATAAVEHRSRLDFDGELFSGPAWERLVAEGAEAQFVLIGEEHGIAENPKLVAQLFAELKDYGYSRLAIEISPTMASLLDDVLADGGLDGLKELYEKPGAQPAFYGMAEEAEMLAALRAAAPAGETVFWGTDYEVLGDRQLLRLLREARMPQAAEAALETLIEASDTAWAESDKRRAPEYAFSFSGDPALVRAVSDAWPEPDPRSAVILNSLEKTLMINRLWMQKQKWASNNARASLQRENFLRHWLEAKRQGETPKLIAKYGASHVVRGLSPTAVYDLGTLLPELAALEGGTTLSLMIMPGADSMTAGMNPTLWRYEPRPAAGGYIDGIMPLMDAAFDDSFTLIDLRELRSVAGMNRGELGDELFRAIHGFDLLLVMSGSTPSSQF